MRGAPAKFEVRSQNVPDEMIEVNFDVQGSVGLYDRQLISNVTLSENNQSAILSVNTLYDNNIEDDEILRVLLTPGENYQIGNPATAEVLITDIDDRKNEQQELISGQQSILPEIIGYVSNQTLSEISSRRNKTDTGTSNFTFNFGGNTAVTDMIKEGGELINKASASWQELLDETKFQLNLYPGTETGTSATLWESGITRN